MKMSKLTLGVGIVAALLGWSVAASGQAPKPLETKGIMEAVTVYRGQALVTRAIEVDGPAGSVDVVVTDLPAAILPNSLYASAPETVQVRAVRFREQAVSDEPREEVRKLDQQIEDLNKSLRENKALQSVLAEKKAYLANLDNFTAAKAKEEMAKGVLNAENIKGVTEFLFAQRSALAKESLQLGESMRTLTEKLTLLQRQRSALTAKLSRSAREAILFIDKPAGKATVRLNYLVSNASWSPMYNIRCGADRKQVHLEYNALVMQMCGEDWSGVKLTLSTASPSMLAEAPILMPLWVALTGRPAGTAQPSAAQVFEGQQAAGRQLRQALQARKSIDGRFEEDYNLNTIANRYQFTEFVNPKDLLLAAQDVRPGDEALSVNYVLPGKISVPSRSDQQMIQIAAPRLEGSFYYLAVPVLTPYVYQNAEMVNTGDVALLAGSVSTYLDGQFMGTGRIPTVAKGQRFTVGFGVDTQLRSARELADKSERIQGGNNELTFKYRLLIENYKDRPVKVRLSDRLPDAKGSDIRITLGELPDKLWEDKVYQRTVRKMGILIWEIDVPAKAADAKAKTVDYEYKMEFDRKMHIGLPSATVVESQKKQFRHALDAMMAQ